MIRNIICYSYLNRLRRFLIPSSIANFERSYTSDAEKIQRNEHERTCQAEVQLQFLSKCQCPDPDTISERDWKIIFSLPNRNQRKKFYKDLYLRQLNMTKEKQQQLIKNELKDQMRQNVKEQREMAHLNYGLGKNSLLLRVSSQRMTTWMNQKLIRSKLFGQKLIVDCTFDEQMCDRELRKIAKYLEKMYSCNRQHIRPFDLHLVGSESSNISINRIHKRIPKLMSASSPIEVHFKCYTELFPKDRLVILTSDSQTTLEYNFNDIYVVGGIFDKGHSTPLMLAKAKSLGLRTARLPLKKFIFRHNNELSFDIVVNILRERQLTENWEQIFADHVIPIRAREYHYNLSPNREYEEYD